MNKQTIRMIIYPIIIICILLIISFSYKNFNKEIAYANYDEDINQKDCEYAMMNYKEDYELDVTDIYIPFIVNSTSRIYDYTYDVNGFRIMSVQEKIDNEIVFSLHCIPGKCDYYMGIIFKMDNGKVLTAELYAVYNEYGIFVSSNCQEDAYEKFLTFALGNNIISEEEADSLRIYNFYRNDNSHGVEFERTLDDYRRKENKAIRANNSVDTYAEGTIYWQDNSTDHNIHYLRRVKIELYDSDALTDEYLGCAYTNNYGYFSIGFQNDTSIFENGCDLFLRVYAGDDNAYVVSASNVNSPYYTITSKTKCQNVATGSTTDFTNESYPYDMSSNSTTRALQISQALLTARDYVWVMMNDCPHSVKAAYPSNGTYYNNNIIYIGESNVDEDYYDWDVIMHEYGHHIANYLGIADSVGGWHLGNVNMVDHYSQPDGAECNFDDDCARHGTNIRVYSTTIKEEGLKIAWSEAWATVFAEIAQIYYANHLSNINNVADGLYTDTKNSPQPSIIYSYENECVQKGDACEESIIGVLFDLFDSGYEENDSIKLSFQQWWNVTTGSQAKTFSEFIQYFYLQYPQYQTAIGSNLTFYKIAPTLISPVNGSELTITAPYFSWFRNGGNSNNNNSFHLIFYAEDENLNVEINAGTGVNYYLTDVEWRDVLFLPGNILYVCVIGYQTNNPSTGGYISKKYSFSRPIYTTNTPVNGEVIITGFYGGLGGDITIPSTINGNTVIGIGDNAFRYRAFTSITLPSTIRTIGSQAFRGCGSLTYVNMEDTQVTRIEEMSFYYCTELVDIYLPSGITYIGQYAFSYVGKNYFLLTTNITTIGNQAFTGCDHSTFYTEYSNQPTGWNIYWNGSNRPVFWGCTLDSNHSYVASFTKSNSNPANSTATNGINNPYRNGYNFDGWYTTSDYSGTQYTNVLDAPNGTLYAKWVKKSCVAEGSLITLADGTQVAVENLTGDEYLLVWNMLTGQFDVAPILFIDNDPTLTYEIIELTFSDGTIVKVIDEHAFFDMTLGEYVFLRSDAYQYIGHYFNKQSYDNNNNMIWTSVQLTNVTIYNEITTAWSPVTYSYLCYYVNGMLSMPGATEGFINIFEVDTTNMQYDATLMASDIATYGLYTYEEFNAIIPIPELVFNAFNGQYLKVSIGKGLITLNQIALLLARYSIFFD